MNVEHEITTFSKKILSCMFIQFRHEIDAVVDIFEANKFRLQIIIVNNFNRSRFVSRV